MPNRPIIGPSVPITASMLMLRSISIVAASVERSMLSRASGRPLGNSEMPVDSTRPKIGIALAQHFVHLAEVALLDQVLDLGHQFRRRRHLLAQFHEHPHHGRDEIHAQEQNSRADPARTAGNPPQQALALRAGGGFTFGGEGETGGQCHDQGGRQDRQQRTPAPNATDPRIHGSSPLLIRVHDAD